jgi:hypothetical protein
MCWKGKGTDRHVSKEDIKVFKVLYVLPNWDKELLAPIYPFVYHLNELYESELDVKRVILLNSQDNTLIDKGLHCYSSDLCFWQKTLPNVIYILRKTYTKRCPALYSYRITDNRTFQFQKNPAAIMVKKGRVAAIVEGVIPSNTTYWINEHGEIVTEKLILKELKVIYDGRKIRTKGDD